MEIFKITDSRDNHRLGNEQKASKRWIEKNLDSADIEKLAKGEQVGVTVRKGRGFSHVTLIARNHHLFSDKDKFLETPLETWMLVPCDLEGEPMIKPDDDRLKAFEASLIPQCQDEYQDLFMWTEGIKRVIFRGFHVNIYGDDIIHKKTGLVVGEIGETTTLLFKTIGELCRALEEN